MALLLYAAAAAVVVVAVLVIRCMPQGTRQRVFAVVWSCLSHSADATLQRRKQELFRDVAGAVVEIGPGVGANARYLRPDRISSLLLAEPNIYMHDALTQAAEAAGFRPAQGLWISSATGDAIPVPAASQDWVLCTLVLCSVPTSALHAVLAEAHRILRPGGKFVFLEHVIADASVYPVRSAAQRVAMATGLWSTLGDGCELTRDTGALLRSEAGAGGWEAGWQLDIREVTVPLEPCSLCSCASGGGFVMALLGGTQVEGTLTKPARPT